MQILTEPWWLITFILYIDRYSFFSALKKSFGVINFEVLKEHHFPVFWK